MPNTTPLTDAINALTTYANETTGASDTNLSDAVGTLVGGYGQGGDGITIDNMIEKELPESAVNVSYSGTATTLSSVFSGFNIESFESDSITQISSSVFYNCTSLKSVNLPNCVTNNQSVSDVFRGCTNLEHVYMPKVVLIGSNSFRDTTSLKKIALPSLTNSRSDFFNGSGVEEADMGQCSNVYINTFGNCHNLIAVIFRKTDSIVVNSNAQAFNNSTLTGYGGTYSGHIYVPSALISSYQSATNWSTLYSNYPDIFQPIEGSIYETQYADGTPIS